MGNQLHQDEERYDMGNQLPDVKKSIVCFLSQFIQF